MPKITIELTLLEAHAVLRALGVANVSDRQTQTDIAPCTWVAQRLVKLVNN